MIQKQREKQQTIKKGIKRSSEADKGQKIHKGHRYRREQ
jgi:hypothetical protein